MAAATTRILLIRHADYDLLDRGILAGRMSGWGLNEHGRAQSMALGKALACRTLAAVVASPLERAQETARAVAAPHHLEVQTEPGFDEVDFGGWTGCGFAELHQDSHWQVFNKFRGVAAPPGGEMMLAVQLRALAALLNLRDRFPNAEVAAVSHADVVKAVLAHALGMPIDLFQRLVIAPASRSILVLGEDFLRIEGVNLPV